MKLIILLILIIFLPIASAIELGISPVQIEFSGKTEEKICRNITLFSKNFSGNLIGEDRWARKFTKNLKDYNLNSSRFNIEVELERKIEAEDRKSIESCIIGENAGKYYGAFLFRAENTSAGVGTWVFVNLTEKDKVVIEREKITGRVIDIREAKEGRRLDSAYAFLFVSEFLVFLSFFLFLRRVRRRE